jgi:hypothetical protein
MRDAYTKCYILFPLPGTELDRWHSQEATRGGETAMGRSPICLTHQGDLDARRAQITRYGLSGLQLPRSTSTG